MNLARLTKMGVLPLLGFLQGDGKGLHEILKAFDQPGHERRIKFGFGQHFLQAEFKSVIHDASPSVKTGGAEDIIL